MVALKSMGFNKVVARHLRERPGGTVKSDADISLAMDVWEVASRPSLRRVILASGDSDFLPLVERLVAKGIEVFVVGPERATAWELIVTATKFWNTAQIPGFVESETRDAPCQEKVG